MINTAQLSHLPLTLLGWLLAAYVVTQPNPVRAAFALIGVIVCAAAHWAFLSAPFLSALLFLVYLGAVMVFFLFIVMTLPKIPQQEQPLKLKKLMIPLLIATVTAPPLALSLTKRGLHTFNKQAAPSLQQLATLLFENYGVLLQYLAFALFVAMIVVFAIMTHHKDSQ